MSEINDLRERVEAAEQRFGLIDEQQRHYSARVIGLIETIEAQLAAARGEIEKQIAENLRLAQDNEELRHMLHSVLRSIEEKTFTSTLQDLESRVSALVASAGAAAPATAQPAATPAGDDAEEIAPADAVIEAEDAQVGEDTMILEAEGDAPAAEDDQPDAEMGAEDDAVEDDAGEPATTEEDAFSGAAFDDVPAEEIAAEMDDASVDDAEPPAEPAAEPAEEPAAEAEMADDFAAAPDPVEEAPVEETQAEAPEGAPEEAPEEAQAEAEDEDDIFAAMNELNAEDPAFTEAAADIAEPGAGAGNEAEAAAEAMAPTVKEIIRRVGDLARELERAETARRAALDSAEPAGEANEAAAAPPTHQAVNG